MCKVCSIGMEIVEIGRQSIHRGEDRSKFLNIRVKGFIKHKEFRQEIVNGKKKTV